MKVILRQKKLYYLDYYLVVQHLMYLHQAVATARRTPVDLEALVLAQAVVAAVAVVVKMPTSQKLLSTMI